MDLLFNEQALIDGNISDEQIRKTIHFGCRDLLIKLNNIEVSEQKNNFRNLLNLMKNSPLAIAEEQANKQHYEITTDFYTYVLGRHMKYSCCYWPEGINNLDEAEKAMLELICVRAELSDSQKILDLGCGWGSTCLYIAQKYPKAKITALSNSESQRKYIQLRCQQIGLENVTVITDNIVCCNFKQQFDKIISIEMFEHMRNYELLLSKLSNWLNPWGKLFIHIFVHRNYAYFFDDNWIAKNYFTGGLMPSDQLLLYFQRDFCISEHWSLNGRHYQKTANAWLMNIDKNRDKIIQLFNTEADEAAIKKYYSWRLFFIATAESFGYGKGQEWFVSHYLMNKR